ncbi:hypothetical protein ACFLVH_04090 [Chloroflexota bacterium]
MSVIGTLKRCELLLGLDNDELQMIADLPSYKEKAYESDGIIFEAGEDANHLYVLEEGQVNLVVKIPTSSSLLYCQ